MAPHAALASADSDILYKNERTLITRRHLPGGGSVVHKQALGTDAQASMRHEASILARLVGVPGVIQRLPDPSPDVLVFRDEGTLSLAQQLLDGRLEVAAILDLAITLARTLSAVHHAGVIHKDINPANILMADDGRRPVLIDFNIASCFAEERPGFTHQSHIAGTLAYMAPEQTGRTGRAVDQRSDLYALGVTLYELTVGRKPFESDDLLEMIHSHMVRTPVAPIVARPELPLMLSNIIMRLLEKEADRRYQSADGLAEDLTRLRDGLARGDAVNLPLGQDDFPMRLTPPSSLIGRDAEIDLLQDAIDKAGRGEGRALLVSGAPGVGKSALINELQPMVTARRGWFVSGKFEQYQREGSSAIIQSLRALGRLLLAEPQIELDRLRERILLALGANVGLGPTLLPEFGLLLGQVTPLVVDDPVEAETRMIQASIDLLKCVVSPEQPLVMVVDDLQWAPAVSLRFLDALLTHDQGLHGLLLVGAYREAEVDAAHPLTTKLARWNQLGVAPPILRLTNLPQSDIGTLIGEMLRLPPVEAGKLGAVISERTEGNPYDTVELVNALRHDGLLKLVNGHWQWNETLIRQYVGDCDVVGLLTRRIDRLPAESQQLLALLACLGGEVNMGLLEVASGLPTALLEAHLAPALEDGLIVAHNGHVREIRFRHDRVQQAMHERMASTSREVQLALARRLAAKPKLGALAAQQYLPTFDAVTDPVECRRVITLFQASAAFNKVVNFELCDRFLSAALCLMDRIEYTPQDQALQRQLQTARHAALYGMGRLDEADRVYEAIVAHGGPPEHLVDAAAVQLASLGNRNRHKEALAIGLDLLKQLGLEQPEDIKTAIGMALFKMAAWIAGTDKTQDMTRPELSDPRLLALAKILSKAQVAAYFCAAKTGAWLTMESHRLWVDHGPCASLMATLCSTPMQLIAIAEDYEGARALAHHLLAVGEARRYEPATSVARFMHSISVAHWFEPFEDCLGHYRKAREGLFQAGELQYAVFTYASWMQVFDSAPSIESCLEEIEGGFAAQARTGDQNFLTLHRPSRPFYKALTGGNLPGQPFGGFSDETFDEAAHEASVATPTIGSAYFHVARALSAALFNDEPALQRHAAHSMTLQSRVPGSPLVLRIHLLQALALSQRLRTLTVEEQPPVLAELDKSLKWLKRRAKDAPFNYLFLQQWIEAERAWAVGEYWAAAAGFNTAMTEVAKRTRPWQRALITERAARFHLAQDMAYVGQPLMQAARDLYEAWGAKVKVQQLHDEFAHLRTRGARQRDAVSRSTIMSSDMVDVMSVLRASQALSSETSLARLNARVGKVLSAMTGAASVLMVVRSEEAASWQVMVPQGDETVSETLEAAAEQGRLPLSAFRYAERTREPLLVAEAQRDERFNRDPYFKDVTHCSMLLLPVLSKGELRAMLLLENRLSRSAFSTDRLDAVSLIAGQLSVSLDNAMLYASLEQKVAERTAALEDANQRLELLSSTDALTGVANRRKFNEALEAEWLRAKRAKTPIGLVMIDIDHFKLYNDHYGHQGGDHCLQQAAAAMSTGLRAGSDLIARYGGEEFVLLLPNTDLDGTYTVAERVRAAVQALNEPHVKSGHGIVTVSIGVTSFVPDADAKPSQHIEVADQALYEAKHAGRNRVCRPA